MKGRHFQVYSQLRIIAILLLSLLPVASKAWMLETATNNNHKRARWHPPTKIHGCSSSTPQTIRKRSKGNAKNLTNVSTITRRQSLLDVLGAATATVSINSVLLSMPSTANAYEADPDKIQESLYLLSRVQEATVQQERLIRKTDLQEVLKRKMKLSLKLVSKSYRLIDQINFLSQYVNPPEEILTATEAGNEAAEALQTAIDYVNSSESLSGTGPLTPEQKEYLKQCMIATRENLFTFVKYMPQDKLENARKRVEVENTKNVEEFGLADEYTDAAIFNPVPLPWK